MGQEYSTVFLQMLQLFQKKKSLFFWTAMHSEDSN